MVLGRNSASLWAARHIAILGNRILLIALLAWSYRALESASAVSILLLAWALPPFILRPLAGRLTEGRMGLLIVLAAQLLRVAALLPLLGMGSEANPQLVVTTAFLAGVLSAFVRTPRDAASADHLYVDELIARVRVPRNAGLSGISMGSIAGGAFGLVLGPAAGTIIFTNADLRGATIATIATWLLSALLLLIARPSPLSEAPKEMRHPLSAGPVNPRQGLLHILRHPPLRTVAIVRLVAAIPTGGLLVTQVAFMVWGVFASSENVGFILAAQGIGILAGIVVASVAGDRIAPSTVMATSLGLMTMGLFGFALSNSMPAAAAFSEVFGFGGGMLALTLVRLHSVHAEEGWHRSTSAGLDMVVEAAALLSVIAMGPLADTITPRFTIVLATIVLAVLGLYAFGSLHDRPALAVEDPSQNSRRPLPASKVPVGTTARRQSPSPARRS